MNEAGSELSAACGPCSEWRGFPADGDSLRGVVNGDMTAWQYADGADTVSYVRTAGNAGKLVAEVRHGGEMVGRAETTLDGDRCAAHRRDW